MPSTQQHCRITNEMANSTILEMMSALTNDNFGSMFVLTQWLEHDPTAVLGFLTCLDSKHLYDQHIWNVYELCGQDIARFIYHVQMELPNQITGQLGVTGPYASQVDMSEFFNKRTHGSPGSYWALENPPAMPDYEYPIH